MKLLQSADTNPVSQLSLNSWPCKSLQEYNVRFQSFSLNKNKKEATVSPSQCRDFLDCCQVFSHLEVVLSVQQILQGPVVKRCRQVHSCRLTEAEIATKGTYALMNGRLLSNMKTSGDSPETLRDVKAKKSPSSCNC
ncbi:hypothetical protein AMECASPLE_029478 [Ameca splendens]|uniref:Uncharacterized protein n=1 Tax=Ameca splendens TaxID=208324 RepID=A0ABV0ZEK4_9TELE